MRRILGQRAGMDKRVALAVFAYAFLEEGRRLEAASR